MTDIHINRDSTAITGFAKAIDHINKLNPDFVLTGGDLIMNNPGTSYESVEEQYQYYLESIQNLEMPVYPILGNHDITGLYQPPGFPKTHPDYGKKMFMRIFNLPAPYYSFNHKGWHIIILDDIRIVGGQYYEGGIDSSQMDWLKEDLQTVTENTPIIMAQHIPLSTVYQQLTKSTIKPLSPSHILVNTPEVLALCKEKNLQLVLQGHLHIVEEMVVKNTRFITGGAISGAWWRGAKDGFLPGFVLVTIENDVLTWEYVTYLPPL